MGLASSQARLLSLTDRNNTIGYQLSNLSMQKSALTCEMTQVTLKYKEALSSKVFKCTNNAGVTTLDLSYNTLMSPGVFAQGSPCFITNSNGKIVLNSKYAEYAKMISPDGSKGGDWESNRAEILSKFTGISADKIESGANTSETGASDGTSGVSLTADEKSKINFYEQIFTAIVENGWVENSEITNNDYLNNMLQNNQYYITTVKDQIDNDGNHYNEYDSTIASNFEKFVSVNDSDAHLEAQVEYEHEKSIINEKESRIDTRMKNLETEQAAIKKMIEGIEKVKNENSERTMSVFG